MLPDFRAFLLLRAQRPSLFEEAEADDLNNGARDWSLPYVTDIQAATSQVHKGLASDEDAIIPPKEKNK